MLKVIVDVNVWISALLNPGNAKDIEIAFGHGKFQVYYPQQLIHDIQRVTLRRRLRDKIQHKEAAELITLLESEGILVEPSNILSLSRDPDDDIYLACAYEARCHYLVTGDKDLLILKNYKRTRIVTPAQFLKIIEY